MKSIVELKNIKKNIGKKEIVKDLSLNINEGEILGLLGPNGAGKTTTIKMIVGLITMNSGDIIIDGKSIEKDFEKAIVNIGAIVENPEMYKFLSGRKNLIHYARMVKGVNEDRINEVIKIVGLEKAIDKKIKTYSLGMRQRLGLAQALLHKPKLLILDEPTNGLDPAGIKEMRKYLKEISKNENVGVLVSSHMLAEMELMCDRIAILQNGVLTSVESVKDFVEENDAKQTMSIKVSDIEKTVSVIKEDQKIEVINYDENEIIIKLNKEDVTPMISGILKANINVYEFKVMPKTLEDKFMEVTGGDEIV